MAYQKVATVDEVPVGTTFLAELDEPICVVRLSDDEVRAVHDTCSHQEYPLHEGFIEEDHIECALHGSMFHLDTGAPDALPATKPIPVYAARIEDGAIWVDTDDQLNDAPVPRH